VKQNTVSEVSLD